MPAEITLSTPVLYTKHVGEVRAAELVAMGLRTCGDLLFHFPRDYLHYTDEAPIAAMKPGDMATVRGTILQTRLIAQKPRRFEALLQDVGGNTDGNQRSRCVLTWFNPYGLDKKFSPGCRCGRRESNDLPRSFSNGAAAV